MRRIMMAVVLLMTASVAPRADDAQRRFFEIAHAGHIEHGDYDQQQNDRADEDEQSFIRASHGI